MDGYLTKPIDVELLRATLTRFVEPQFKETGTAS